MLQLSDNERVSIFAQTDAFSVVVRGQSSPTRELLHMFGISGDPAAAAGFTHSLSGSTRLEEETFIIVPPSSQRDGFRIDALFIFSFFEVDMVDIISSKDLLSLVA